MSNLFKPARYLAMPAPTAAKPAHASGTIASRLLMTFKFVLLLDVRDRTRICRCCASAFLVALSALSYAETTPATPVTSSPVLGWASGPDWGVTQAEACTQAIIHNGGASVIAYVGVGYADNGQLQCRVESLGNGFQFAWSNLRPSYGCTNFTPPYN